MDKEIENCIWKSNAEFVKSYYIIGDKNAVILKVNVAVYRTLKILLCGS